MRDMLIEKAGVIWDSWDKKTMITFWNSHCIEPWDNWTMASCIDVPLCTPSQNTQESWHNNILIGKIPQMFGGSTEHVLAVAMPQLVKMDGYLLPDELSFDVIERSYSNAYATRILTHIIYLTNTIAASAAPARFPTSFDGLLTSIGGHSPGRHLGLLRVPSILRPLLRPTPRDAAVAGGAHGRGLPARRSCVRLHLRRRRAEPSACRRYALMRSISSRRSVWFTLNSSSGVAARRNAAPSHECADEASPAFPCVCRRGG